MRVELSWADKRAASSDSEKYGHSAKVLSFRKLSLEKGRTLVEKKLTGNSPRGCGKNVTSGHNSLSTYFDLLISI